MRLGAWYVDKITGFMGIAIGHCQYLTGCNQTLLQPACEEGKRTIRPVGEWFDDQRLLEVSGGATIELDNGTTPGHDKEAPKR